MRHWAVTTVVGTAVVSTLCLSAQQPIRVGIDLVHFGIAVTDRQGRPVTGLTADDFAVLERGQPQAVKFFAPGDAASAPELHIGFLLDVSGSMQEHIKDVRTAAIKFLNQAERAADVTLVDFDTEVRVARFTGDTRWATHQRMNAPTDRGGQYRSGSLGAI